LIRDIASAFKAILMEAIIPHVKRVWHVPFLVTAFTLFELCIEKQHVFLGLFFSQVKRRIVYVCGRKRALAKILVIQLEPIINRRCLSNEVVHFEINFNLRAAICSHTN